jgi:hypothetical protein
MTIDKISVWGQQEDDVNDTLMIGVYRGNFESVGESDAILIGEGSVSTSDGRNVVPITAISGQNLNLTLFENFIIGVHVYGGTLLDEGFSVWSSNASINNLSCGRYHIEAYRAMPSSIDTNTGSYNDASCGEFLMYLHAVP